MIVSILGAGSWGTALAIQSARAGNPTRLWGRDPDRITAMAEVRQNLDYLPGFQFPELLQPEAELNLAVDQADLVMVVTPSHAFPEMLRQLRPLVAAGEGIAWATKGFEPGSGRLLHEVAAELLGARPTAVLTGPSFAQEVANGLPTAVTVASADHGFARSVAAAFHAGAFRAYSSDDIVGAELGGAMKNVIAVGTGICDGMRLGTNARAALVTRGMAEMMRLSHALGARRETLMGLSGMGDLVLTCTGDLSRNRRFGLALGRGQSVAEALKEIGQVVEGARAAEEVLRLAGRSGVELPISEQIHQIILGQITPREGVQNLLAREPRAEIDY